MDNETFLASLNPDVREEILLHMPQNELDSLPPEIRLEAQEIRDRQINRHDSGIYEFER